MRKKSNSTTSINAITEKAKKKRPVKRVYSFRLPVQLIKEFRRIAKTRNSKPADILIVLLEQFVQGER